MKRFTEFLTESQKQYAFRVKLACECTKDHISAIKSALDKYKVSAIAEPKTTPIAETHAGFEHLKNVSITTLDIMVDYPCNPVQVREMIRDAMKVSESQIMVLTPGEEANALPVAPVNKGKALLDTFELGGDDSGQNQVGLKKLESLLKELNQEKHGGIQYKGVNDQIQAKKAFQEKTARTTNDLPAGKSSVMGNRKMPGKR